MYCHRDFESIASEENERDRGYLVNCSRFPVAIPRVVSHDAQVRRPHNLLIQFDRSWWLIQRLRLIKPKAHHDWPGVYNTL